MSKVNTFFKMLREVRNPLTYMGDYFGMFKGKEVVYKMRGGSKLKLRGGATDRFIVNEIWMHKSYNPKDFEIRPEDVVVDIGGHAGVFTVRAATKAKRGKVYVFEPSKENFKALKENIRLNNLNNVKAFNLAASDKKGKLKFYISETKNKGQNSKFKLAGKQREEVVDKVSFKKFLGKLGRVDFLKMDCEGAEYDIFPSLGKKEFDKIKKISMEYHNYNGHNGKEIKDILEKQGFKVEMIPEGKKFGTIYAKR